MSAELVGILTVGAALAAPVLTLRACARGLASTYAGCEVAGRPTGRPYPPTGRGVLTIQER